MSVLWPKHGNNLDMSFGPIRPSPKSFISLDTSMISERAKNIHTNLQTQYVLEFFPFKGQLKTLGVNEFWVNSFVGQNSASVTSYLVFL